MAFALPVIVTNNTPPAAGAVVLPAFLLNNSAFSGGAVVLPAFVMGAAGTGGAVVLPAFVMGAAGAGGTVALPSIFLGAPPLNFIPTGGGIGGGSAVIYGDPFIPKGGGIGSGAAPVSLVSVLLFQLYPYGGGVGSGAAIVSSNIAYMPSGGGVGSGAATVKYYNSAPIGGGIGGGAAVVQLVKVAIYDVIKTDNVPKGGGIGSGSAPISEVINFNPLGGGIGGGAAAISEAILFSPAGGGIGGGLANVVFVSLTSPTGGGIASGIAPVAVVYNQPTSGGGIGSGAAIVSVYQALFVPSGGGVGGGTALAYMLPSGIVITAENPTNAPFPAWAFNVNTSAPSRYDNLPANSITTLNGVTYVATAGGIYALDADTDVGRPINAHITLAKTDFNTSQDKKVSEIYVGSAIASKLKARVIVNKNSPLYYIFNDDRAKGSSARGMRTTIGKGLVGRYWQVRLENISGADFEIETVELNPLSLPRRGA